MKTTATKPLLSKSTFVRSCKCIKSLHLYKYSYHLRDETSAAQQAIFDKGQELDIYARQLVPGGIDCSTEPAYDYAASLAKTEEALENGAKVLYERGFVFSGVYAAIDILVQRKGYWYIYEVKQHRSERLPLHGCSHPVLHLKGAALPDERSWRLAMAAAPASLFSTSLMKQMQKS